MFEARELCRLIKGRFNILRSLEVGCGVGLKLLLANQLGFHAAGVEINEKFVSVAKMIVPDAKIHHGNALDFSYSGYDVIYLYCPFSNGEKERELELKILEESSPNTILHFINKTGCSSELKFEEGGDDLKRLLDQFQRWEVNPESGAFRSHFVLHIKTTCEELARLQELREHPRSPIVIGDKGYRAG